MNLKDLCATLVAMTFVAALFGLSGCGGGGNGDNSSNVVVAAATAASAASAPVTAVKVVVYDATFRNVPVRTASVVAGQLGVEAAAFRIEWADPNSRSGIAQLVFTVKGPVMVQ